MFPGDRQQEGITVIKQATRRSPSEPWNVPTEMPVPLAASIPTAERAEGGKELRWRARDTAAGETSWRWGGDPSRAGPAAGAAAARGQHRPGPATPEPLGAAAAPGLAQLRITLSGLQRREHRHRPALGWQRVS